MKALFTVLIGCLVIVGDACSQKAAMTREPTLEIVGEADGGAKIKVRLTAGSAPVFFQRDAATKIVPHEVEVQRGKTWTKADSSIWDIRPEQPTPQVKPGRSVTFDVRKPAVKGTAWRIGVLVYSGIPARGVPSMTVWTRANSP